MQRALPDGVSEGRQIVRMHKGARLLNVGRYGHIWVVFTVEDTDDPLVDREVWVTRDWCPGEHLTYAGMITISDPARDWEEIHYHVFG